MSRNKFHLTLLAALCLSLSGIAAGSELIAPEDIEKDEAKYNLSTAEYGEIVRSKTTSADVMYPNVTLVRYEGAPAVYIQTLVKKGDVVSAGDVIMRVEPIRDDVKLADMQLTLERTRLNFEDGKLQRQKAIADMQENLEKQRGAADKRRAQLQLDRLNIQLQQYIYQQEKSIADQEAALAELEESYSTTAIAAPCDGIISELATFRQNATIGDKTTICYINDQYTILLSTSGNPLHYGMDVDVHGGSNNNQISVGGKVVFSAAELPEVGLNVNLIEVDPVELADKVDLSNQSELRKLRNIKITGNSVYLSNVLLIDTNCITTESGHDYIRRLGADGTIQKRCVLRALSNSNRSWILQGLNEGENVIIE